MKRYILAGILPVALLVCFAASCVHQPSAVPADGGFPPQVAGIFISKCAVAGCHNAASYANASNLQLDTWDHLFKGGSSGAVVVPYSAEFSPLLYYVNTDSSLGTVAVPTMPYSTGSTVRPALTKAEYLALQTWIANGAPDKSGNVAFATDAVNRQKMYMTQQGCDLLAVIDAQTGLVMRYIPIGQTAGIESPHCVRISADGSSAYTSFLAGNVIQKIDTRTDQVTGATNVGSGSWNILYLAPADTALIASDWQGEGYLDFIHTPDMLQRGLPQGGGGTFVYPHGITSCITYDTFFITAQYGNVIYKYAPSVPLYKQISLDGNPPSAAAATTGSTPDPHEVLMVPDYSRYFVTCEGTNEVRVMNAHNDSVITHIPVGTFPQELAISRTKPYIFVTCMEDNSTLAGRRGSVYVINYNTYEVVAVLYGDFYQPHGLAVDDRYGRLYVASTNANPNGPAPHHATACAGRAGWYTIYDINTLQPLNDYRYEVTVMPYSVAARFRN